MNNIEIALDKELARLYKLDENKNKHITYMREMAIRNLGLQIVSPYTKKGYVEPKNTIKWGSHAGYDRVYFVKQKEGKNN